MEKDLRRGKKEEDKKEKDKKEKDGKEKDEKQKDKKKKERKEEKGNKTGSVASGISICSICFSLTCEIISLGERFKKRRERK